MKRRESGEQVSSGCSLRRGSKSLRRLTITISEEARFNIVFGNRAEPARFHSALENALHDCDPKNINPNYCPEGAQGSLLAEACRLYESGQSALLQKLIDHWHELSVPPDLSIMLYDAGHDLAGVDILWFAAKKATEGSVDFINKIIDAPHWQCDKSDINIAPSKKNYIDHGVSVFTMACHLAMEGHPGLLDRIVELFDAFKSQPNINACAKTKANPHYDMSPLYYACRLVENGMTGLADLISAKFALIRKKVNINRGRYIKNENEGASVFWYAAKIAAVNNYTPLLNAILNHLNVSTVKPIYNASPKYFRLDLNGAGLYYFSLMLAFDEKPQLLKCLEDNVPDIMNKMMPAIPRKPLENQGLLSLQVYFYLLAVKGENKWLQHYLDNERADYVKSDFSNIDVKLIKPKMEQIKTHTDLLITIKSVELRLKILDRVGVYHHKLTDSIHLACHLIEHFDEYKSAEAVLNFPFQSHYFILFYEAFAIMLSVNKAIDDKGPASQVADLVNAYLKAVSKNIACQITRLLNKKLVSSLLASEYKNQAIKVIQTYQLANYQHYPFEHLYALVQHHATVLSDSFGTHKRLALRYGICALYSQEMCDRFSLAEKARLQHYLAVMIEQLRGSSAEMLSREHINALIDTKLVSELEPLARCKVPVELAVNQMISKLERYIADDRLDHAPLSLVFNSFQKEATNKMPDLTKEGV